MPDDNERLTMSVPEAGKKYFGISRDGSYRAAERGDIPTIRVGRLLRVPVRAMEQRLEAVCRERNGERDLPDVRVPVPRRRRDEDDHPLRGGQSRLAARYRPLAPRLSVADKRQASAIDNRGLLSNPGRRRVVRMRRQDNQTNRGGVT